MTGSDGIAIATTVGKLVDSLPYKNEFDIGFKKGVVQYVDHEADVYTERPPERSSALQCLFEKRREYQHEREVRFVLVNPKETELPLNNLAFIEKIVISPAFPTWAISSMKAALLALGVTNDVEPSALSQTNP